MSVRRFLHQNELSGSVPSEFGYLNGQCLLQPNGFLCADTSDWSIRSNGLCMLSISSAFAACPSPPLPPPPPSLPPPLSPPPPSPPPSAMTAALMRFFDASDGFNWANHIGWGEGEPCRDRWHGVFCCPTSHPLLKMAFDVDEVHNPTTDRCLDADGRSEGVSPSTLKSEAAHLCGTEDTCVVVALCAAPLACPRPPHITWA